MLFGITFEFLTLQIKEKKCFQDKRQGSFTGITSAICVIKLYYMRKYEPKFLDLFKALKSRVADANEEETE